jgi:hypothetical protein
MRVFAASMIALGLFAMPAMAAGGAANTSSAASAGPTTAAQPAAKAAPQPAKPAAATSKAASPAKPAEEMETELQQLRDAIAMQAQQLQDQQKKMQQLEDQLKASAAPRENLSASPAASASATPSTSAAPTASATNAETSPSSTVAVSTNPGASAGGADQNPDQVASWRFKGVTFTPGGFFAAESVWRQRAMNADVNSPFNSAPLPGNSQYNISEFNAGGRQSRIAMLVQGKLSNVKIGGYYEADFLSAGVTSNDNQSNSYTLRQRQFWAQAAFDSGFTITGGQMWSLVTQTAKGLDPRTEVLPETIDAQYSVGFSWARQYGVRFEKDFGNKVWVAASVEQPQITFKQGGTTTNPFLYGALGTGGGLYNSTTAYSFNETPDFVFKAAFEPGFGHYEVFGLVSTFRDRLFPTGATPYNTTTAGGGGGANAWLPFDNAHINVGLHVLVGNGVGRYGSAQATPDVTTALDGSFATVRSYQGLATLAFHYPKWDVYFHAGEEYGERTQFDNGTTYGNEGFGAVGFNNGGCWTETNPTASTTPGALSNCANNIKDIVEGTAGLWYSFYNGPKGTVKLGLQYSYEAYNTWTGLGPTGVCSNTAYPGCAPKTNENMFFTSFRYYIP